MLMNVCVYFFRLCGHRHVNEYQELKNVLRGVCLRNAVCPPGRPSCLGLAGPGHDGPGGGDLACPVTEAWQAALTV